jgi:hypothetical protein
MFVRPTALTLLLLAAGCARSLSDPDAAFAPYPRSDQPAASIDVQVFREGEHVVIVNSTARSYRDFTLWLNQRYGRTVERLAAGETIRLHLATFHDERGEAFRSGGFFGTEEPTPLVLAEIQEKPDAPVIGLVAIPE